MLLIGKPSISMGHLYHGYVSHNQRVDHEDINHIMGDEIWSSFPLLSDICATVSRSLQFRCLLPHLQIPRNQRMHNAEFHLFIHYVCATSIHTFTLQKYLSEKKVPQNSNSMGNHHFPY